jgi:hypothetical protein
MFRFSDWRCSGAARLTLRAGITAPGRAVFRPLDAACVTQSAHPVQHVARAPPVRNDPGRHHNYIASPDPAPPQRPRYGRTVGNLGQHRRPRCTSQGAEGTNVAAPDTIAKLIRGVVFLAGNDCHRAGLPRGSRDDPTTGWGTAPAIRTRARLRWLAGTWPFAVPADLPARRWDVVSDTFDPAAKNTVAQELTVEPRSFVILQSRRGGASDRSRGQCF